MIFVNIRQDKRQDVQGDIMKKQCQNCLCSTCLNSCKCHKCKEKIKDCKQYIGFFQLSIFDQPAKQNMRVLIACEESQRVCIEFRKLGHEAYSCDIEECSGGRPEWHIQDDVLPLLNGNCSFKTVDGIEHRIDGKWDMIVAFPPCTYLSNAGARHLWKGHKLNKERYEKGLRAKEFFMQFYNADCEKIAIENPIPSLIYELPKRSQIIQPYQFGHNATKKTCLWLKGLPLLKPQNEIERPIYREFVQRNGKTRKSCWVMEQTKGKDRAKNRAKTFPGIAKAMAQQWGCKNAIYQMIN